MVHEFFGIHSPRFFGIQCPTIFCDFGLFNSLAQAGGGGPYYMIFHYQKHTVLNYWRTAQPGRMGEAQRGEPQGQRATLPSQGSSPEVRPTQVIVKREGVH